MSHHLQTNRRNFLKQLGASTLPFVMSGPLFGAASPGNKLSVALLGCGGRMRQILPSILSGGAEVVAMCDADSRRTDRIKGDNDPKNQSVARAVEKAKVYEDYRELLAKEKSADAVVIAAGQRWHVPMSKAALKAGKHVFCEKPLAHSAAEAREIRELAKQLKLVTQVGTQGGSTGTFRRSMEVIQAGMLGKIPEVHCWITRSFPPSAEIAQEADPIPAGLNWDFWCGPSRVLPFKNYYLGGCLAWGRWLDFGDGHLADMGAHAINLPWRALKLGAAQRAAVEIPEPLKDSYPSANTFRWDFPARENFAPVTVYWHDGRQAGPPEALGKEMLSNYDKVPSNGVLFAGEKGILFSDAWGVGGKVKLKGDKEFYGVLAHEAAKNIPASIPPAPKGHMEEWINACKGTGETFQGFVSSADIAEVAMVGMVALRLGKPIEWDSQALKVKGMPEADKFVHLPQRQKWL